LAVSGLEVCTLAFSGLGKSLRKVTKAGGFAPVVVYVQVFGVGAVKRCVLDWSVPLFAPPPPPRGPVCVVFLLSFAVAQVLTIHW